VLRDALKAAKNGSAPIELLVENTDYYKTYKIDYTVAKNIPTWSATNPNQTCSATF
jgi:hypothetical protein